MAPRTPSPPSIPARRASGSDTYRNAWGSSARTKIDPGPAGTDTAVSRWRRTSCSSPKNVCTLYPPAPSTSGQTALRTSPDPALVMEKESGIVTVPVISAWSVTTRSEYAVPGSSSARPSPLSVALSART